MEGLPRTPQPADRRVVNRTAETAYRSPEEPRVAAPEQPVSRRAVDAGYAPSSAKKQGTKRLWVIVGSLVLVVILGAIGWSVWSNGRSAVAGIDAGRYQAVYLMNGQIYFGKLTALGNSQLKLTHVYYLQTTQPTSSGTTTETPKTTDASNAQLIKLSNAVYGPSDEMVISKDQVLYFQNLDPNGKATKLIDNDR